MPDVPEQTPSGPSGELSLVGRLTAASNATFLVADDAGARYVYKPVAGEAPLRDFPPHTLSRREVAAYRLSEAAGFGVVPPTWWLDDGPAGPGSVQAWIDVADGVLVSLVVADEVPDGWFGFVIASDDQGRDVALVHADHPGLRRLAVFDAIINNTDRKGGHVLVAEDGGVFGCDHGVTFHVDDKLRTVLWGWAGDPLTDDDLALVARAAESTDVVADWLALEEVDALVERCERLMSSGVLPHPTVNWRALPWPPI